MWVVSSLKQLRITSQWIIANIFLEIHTHTFLKSIGLKFMGHKESSSVQFSHSVVSDSLRPHESQHTRPPCPSPTPRVHWDSRPSSQWCHPAISSCVVPFSSCPQSLPASESFPMSQLFAWGGQSTGVSLHQIQESILGGLRSKFLCERQRHQAFRRLRKPPKKQKQNHREVFMASG